MNLCRPVQVAERVWECPACKRRHDRPFVGECGTREVGAATISSSTSDPRCTCQLAAATKQWNESGRPVVTEAQAAARLAACRACDHWEERGRRLALSIRMATLRCPLSKWADASREKANLPTPHWLLATPHSAWLPTIMCPIDRLNLLYHVAPIAANDVWRRNVAQVVRRWDVFAGRKLVAIATGENMDSPAEVRAAFPGDAEFIEVPNDPRLREATSFPRLLAAIQSTVPGEASFFAHTKGNSNQENRPEAMTWWRNAMYHHLLDHREVVRDALRRFPCVGTNKMVWPPGAKPPYPTRLRHGHWMFAGTFFWFRHDAVFSRAWQNVPDDRYGAEAWLSGLFEPHEGCTLFQSWPVERYPTPSPYDPAIYTDPIDD